MATKSVRRLDDLGRVVLPSNIRKALNLGPRSVVEVDLDDDNETVRIRTTSERCSVCGEPIDGRPHAEVDANGKKLVCYRCAQAVAQDMIRRM